MKRKVAFVHDWLTVYSGAERVLEQMFDCYPDSDLFSLVDFVPDNLRGFLRGKKPVTTFLQKIPGARRIYRHLLPLMPFAIEQHDLSGYDLVISSSHAVAKGVILGPDTLHICMCYSPMRYAWDLQHQYLREAGLDRGLMTFPVRWLLHKLRIWDSRSANGVDHFIAISKFIQRRIFRTYRRDSTVIYPPVDVNSFELKSEKSDYYLTASRMVPYKKMDLIADAFSRMPDKKLIIIGDGPQMSRVQQKASNNVEILGYQSSAALKSYLQSARAFVFAAEEDFGIAPLEAQACGTPVIAFGKGGALETIVSGRTGLFFYEQTVEAIVAAVKEFESMKTIDPNDCRENALRFSEDTFRRNFVEFVEAAWKSFEETRLGAQR